VQIFYELFETYQVRIRSLIQTLLLNSSTYSLSYLFLPVFLPPFYRSTWNCCSNIQNRGVGVFITHLRSGPRTMFHKAGIVDLLGADVFHDSLSDAIARVERHWAHKSWSHVLWMACYELLVKLQSIFIYCLSGQWKSGSICPLFLWLFPPPASHNHIGP